MARAQITNTTQYNARQGVSITCITQEPTTQYEGAGRGNQTTNDAKHHTELLHDELQTKQLNTTQHNTTTYMFILQLLYFKIPLI